MFVCLAIPPTFTPNGSLSDQLAFSGRQHTLVCEAIGAPMPTYQWKKDGTPLGPGNIDFDISTPGQLILKSVNALLQGSYTCVAKSSIDQIMIGESNTTAHLTVVGKSKVVNIVLRSSPSFSQILPQSLPVICLLSLFLWVNHLLLIAQLDMILRGQQLK